MTKRNFVIFSIVILATVSSLFLEGRDGGGKGGGRPGGGGERSIQRSSPSASRPQNRPSTPQVNKSQVSRPQASPSVPQVNRSQISRPMQQSRPQIENRTRTSHQIEQFMKSSTPQRRDEGVGRDNGRFRDVGNRVRTDIGSRYNQRNNWFKQNFWNQHGYYPPYYNDNINWWLPATTVGIGTWLGWQDQPYYYSSYDDFGYAAYPSDYYYADSYNVQSEPQVQVIEPAATLVDWMPLGVFSVITTSQTTPSMFIQLALRKNGEIAGTYFNAILEQNYELEGMVSAETQIAAWKISNNPNSPVFQTGIYNLSENEVPIRVYFQNSTTQDWLLIRIEG